MPDVSLNGIEFQIKGSTGNASSSIDSLVGKLNALKAALENAGNVKTLANGLKGLQKAMEGISKADVSGTTSALRALGKTAQDLQGLANMSKDLASFARAMVKLSEDPTKLHELAAALNIVGSVDLTNLVAASDALRAFADAMRAINSGGGSRETEAQATAWSRLGNAINGIVNGGAKGFMRLLAFPFTRAAKDIGGYAKSIWGVVSGFKRIVGYRLIRSIIREITQAFSEGIKNLYGWSKAMGGATISGKNFAQTMDGLATSSLYFKNSIGAMVAPIISALAPAIDYIIDKVVALINVINQLMALLGGATSWNKAIRKASEFEDAAGGAGGAAKEALRYLAPFDELNRLPDDNKGGGGGGGTDYSGMFEEQTEFLEGLKDFADSIRAAIDAGDWEGLGVLLGDKVNELIEKIDFESLGTSLGEKINALFTTRYWTLKAINFQTIGAKIAEFLNSALGSIDFETVGRSFAQKFTLLPDMIIGFLGETDWKLIGTSIGNYIRGVFDEWSEWLSGVDWEQLGYNIAVYIGQAIDGLDTNSLAKSIKTFLTKAVSAALSLLEGFAKALFNGGTFNTETTVSVNAGISDFDMFDDTGRGEAAWRNALVSALPILATALGFKVGGIQGAAFGLTIGIGVKGVIEIVQFFEGGRTDADTLIHGIVDVLPAVGGVIGFFVGGPGGAAVGAAIGMGIRFAINALDSALGDVTLHDFFSGIGTALLTFYNGLSLIPVGNQLAAELSLPLRIMMTIGGFMFNGGDGEGESGHASGKWDEVYNPVKEAIEDYSATDPIILETHIGHGGHTSGTWDAPYSGAKEEIEQVASSNPVEIPAIPKPDVNGPVFTTEDLLGGKDAIEVPVTAKATGVETNSDGSLKTGFKQPWMPTYAWAQGTYYKSDGSLSTEFRQPFMNSYVWSAGTYYNSDGSLSVGFRTPFINTNAFITKYDIKPTLKSSDGDLKINGTFNIVKLTGIKNIDQVKAGGGLYNSSGWHPIQNFAGGGSPFGGQIFRARENGNPELVGTLRGSTAVMNNDQIVASVSSGVARAIAGIHFQMTGLSASAPAMEESANEDTMYRAFRRALDETDFGKDISIDGEPIYQSVVRRNRQNTRATGVNQLAMA